MIKTLYSGKYLQLIQNGSWEYVSRINCKNIAHITPVAYIEDIPNIILVKQFRPSLQKYVIGCPAGLIGDVADETLEVGALRELIEETGYTGRLKLMTFGPPSSGLSDEVIHFYLADQLLKISLGGGDETENIIVETVPLHIINDWLEVQAKIENIIDPKVYVGLYFAGMNASKIE